ncbi:MAG: MBL fold metallo-hydrolase, partial [Clostridia bacterium]
MKQPKIVVTPFHPEVTGSCFSINRYYDGITKTTLLDCGLFQEAKFEYLNQVLDVVPSNVDAIIVSHAHIDHIGKLPFLVASGFKGPIIGTEETGNIMDLSLKDSYSIMKRN